MTSGSDVVATSLGKVYGRRHALRDASFVLPAGAVTAIVGHNGSGKTTTFNILAGRMRQTSGEVRFGERDLSNQERGEWVGYLAHQSYVYGALTARENLALVAGLYRKVNVAFDAILERVSLAKHADRPARAFSRGMVQRLALARLLVADPHVWLLDEPASGLDSAGRAWLEAEIRALAGAGKVVALSSHSRQMVSDLASHVVVLQNGRVMHHGALDRDGGTDGSATAVQRLFAEYIG